MTRDDIIRLAREVWSAGDVYIGPSTEPLERFAALVADEDREACAQVCETHLSKLEHADKAYNNGVKACVEILRARGEE